MKRSSSLKIKLGHLFSDLGRKLHTIRFSIRDGRWKLLRLTLKTTVKGLTTFHCERCTRSNWYVVSRFCSSCQMDNFFQALKDVPDEPCVACGSDTDQICENCEAPLCYDCDSKHYHDVLTCKDEAACSRRCDEAKQ